MIFFSNLKVKEQVGEGLNAFVYKAELRDRSLGIAKTVAYKVLKRKEDANHFRKELSNLMQVNGRRLVKFYGWKKYRGFPGLIIEYVDGSSLFEVVNSLILSKEEKCWVLSEVFQALLELKQSNLFHGDLSPKNIMIDVYGEVKLIDFGLTNWRTKLVEATPGFISPRLLDGDEPSYETDLHSFSALESYLGVCKEDGEFDLESVKASIGGKISILKEEIETEQQVLSPQNSYNRTDKLKIKRLFLAGLLILGLNFPYQVSLSQVRLGFLVRSTDWMAIRKEGSQGWCYTPCKLTYIRGGRKRVFWKSSSSSGLKVLDLNKRGFAQLNQADFKL